MDKKAILDKFTEFLDSVLGGSNTDTVQSEIESETDVVKSVDEMERRAMFVILAPSFEDGTTDDLHEDWYSVEDVEKACINFNKHCNKAGLYHAVTVESDLVEIEQSFITPSSFTLEDGREIRKGTWCMWTHFPKPTDSAVDVIWPEVLSGKMGMSVDCKAKGHNLDDN